MDISGILDRGNVVLSVKVKSKRQLLEDLAERAASATGRPATEIFDVLLARERLGTTGIGGGLALPHGMLPGLERLYACFVRLDEAVDFEAVDGEPVDLVFVLLAPESAGVAHVKVLTRISRIVGDGVICDRLRSAPTGDAIYDLLAGHVHSRAA